jgi:tRNA(fMet)-specific endonuclease VapC
MLDTNIVSALVRDPHGRVTEHIARAGESRVCTNIIVASELRYGALKKRSARLTHQLDAVLAVLPVLPLEVEVDRHYGEVRLHVERRGTTIGANDLLIAAHARALELILVTDNVREFARVPKLTVRNWLDR